MTNLREISFKLIKFKNRVLYRNAVLKTITEFNNFTNENIEQYNNSRKYGYEKHLCNAPFVSLYFGLQGDISVCCLNRTYLLGNIKQDTIDSCWNGNKIIELRKSIENQSLHLGCEHCKNQIKAKNYNNLVANEYDGYYSNNLIYPKVITFELENTCNLACVFCSGTFSSTFNKHFDKLPEKGIIYDDDFIKQVQPYLHHLKKANFLGGEPFLIESYLTIIEYLIEHNPACEIHIQTNGHIFNNRVKNMLIKGNIHIGISLESMNTENFNQIRKFGNWKKLLKNITHFKEYSKTKKINISVTPIQETVHELNDILNFANKNNLELFFNILYSPYHHAIWSMNAEQLNSIQHELKHKTIQLNTRLEKSNYNNYLSFLNLIDTWIAQSTSKNKNVLLDCNLAKEEILLKIKHHLYYVGLYDDETKINIINNLNSKLTTKVNSDKNKYTLIFNDLLTMPDDVIFGCVSHYSF